ncbi:MAG: hypothetical protein C0490_05375 [Marivirga sp.]|nr:hypothetical protein [Marivirga sp.]
MESVSILPSVKSEKHDAFQRFCSSLKNPVFTENNHIIASVNVVCYKDALLLPLWGEILLFTHGYGYGTVRFSDGDVELFDEGIYNLLENAECKYLTGRNDDVLVIERPLPDSKCVHRLDLTEDVKRFAMM